LSCGQSKKAILYPISKDYAAGSVRINPHIFVPKYNPNSDAERENINIDIANTFQVLLQRLSQHPFHLISHHVILHHYRHMFFHQKHPPYTPQYHLQIPSVGPTPASTSHFPGTAPTAKPTSTPSDSPSRYPTSLPTYILSPTTSSLHTAIPLVLIPITI